MDKTFHQMNAKERLQFRLYRAKRQVIHLKDRNAGLYSPGILQVYQDKVSHYERRLGIYKE